MMKICMVLGSHFSFIKGGAEIQADILANNLIKRDHEIHYICFGKKNIKKPMRIKKNYYIYRVKRPYKNLNILCIMNKKHIYNLLDEIKPDIIYQRAKFPFGDLISVYGYSKNIPIVSAISMDEMCKKNKIGLNLRAIPDIIENRMRLNYFKKSNLIISQTKNQKKMLKNIYGVKSIVIPNAHSIPSSPFKKKTPPLICWIASIKKLKQPDVFLRLAEKFTDTNAIFIMAGRSASGNYQEFIESKVNSLSNAKYLGEITFEKTNKLISRSSIFVNTSTTEGFPNTYIQAWLRETPVVTLNCDTDDILKDNMIGFHSKTFEGLVKDVRYLIDNENFRKYMGKKARNFAKKNFDIEKIIGKYENIFIELTSK